MPTHRTRGEAQIGPLPLGRRGARRAPPPQPLSQRARGTNSVRFPPGRPSISIAARAGSSSAIAARSIPSRWKRRSPSAPIARTRAPTGMGPDAVIDEVLKSGLRGRGGRVSPSPASGRPPARSSPTLSTSFGTPTEGDPGAFMDRSVLEGDPHAVIEGMLIGSLAVGAHEGYIRPQRFRWPFPPSPHAIQQAEEARPPGRRHLRQRLALRIKVRRGAGAFVCGEETSLIASIEGYAGEPALGRPSLPSRACGSSPR